jgi:succinate dehydrogenase subunit D
MSRRIGEPVLWLMFSAGGVVAALVLPILLFLFGLAFPLGWLSPPDHAHIHAVVSNPITRLALLAVCVLALMHAAHRLRPAAVHGLRLEHVAGLAGVLCYGAALAGSLAAAYVLLA